MLTPAFSNWLPGFIHLIILDKNWKKKKKKLATIQYQNKKKSKKKKKRR